MDLVCIPIRGSSDAGAYTTSSMQADIAARDYQNMTILFSAGNDGVDNNGNGEVDLDSIGSPATAKSVLTVGASENDRPSITTVYGPGYGSPISTDQYADNISGLAAFSSRGPTDDNRVKPEVVAPGTFVLSALTRYNTIKIRILCKIDQVRFLIDCKREKLRPYRDVRTIDVDLPRSLCRIGELQISNGVNIV